VENAKSAEKKIKRKSRTKLSRPCGPGDKKMHVFSNDKRR
jgi:hypothetical protein